MLSWDVQWGSSHLSSFSNAWFQLSVFLIGRKNHLRKEDGVTTWSFHREMFCFVFFLLCVYAFTSWVQPSTVSTCSAFTLGMSSDRLKELIEVNQEWISPIRITKVTKRIISRIIKWIIWITVSFYFIIFYHVFCRLQNWKQPVLMVKLTAPAKWNFKTFLHNNKKYIIWRMMKKIYLSNKSK